MRLSQITAQSFRNLSDDPVFFGAGVTVIAGNNAQGKTNLLEAVAVLCGQRSFRRALPREMAADGMGFTVSGLLARCGLEEKLAVTWSQGDGRRFQRGEKTIGFREASGFAPAVFLSHEHRELVTGSPGPRRRFLDRMAFFVRPAAGADLALFERALSERNALLARLRERATRAVVGELEAWTEQFARAGAAVRRHRREALKEWFSFFAPLAREAGPEYAEIRVDYAAQEDSEGDLAAACARLGSAERRRGHALAGPQRDELAFSRAGRPLAAEASAGELHRAVALAKLAEWHAVAKAAGEPPLFGVDEFDAGLSAGWAEAFLASLPRAETVLLTTASEPSRWRRIAVDVLEMRAGRAARRPLAVNG